VNKDDRENRKAIRKCGSNLEKIMHALFKYNGITRPSSISVDSSKGEFVNLFRIDSTTQNVESNQIIMMNGKFNFTSTIIL
jgi:hypothetical protein